ncbi:MAG: UDP-N-acetylenolpyruvoylglucosamine reductase, partial [Halieaceae bacterium]
GATQSDVLSLALEIQGSVRDRFDCCLDVEPRIYSAEGVLLQPDLRVSLS